MAAPYIHPSLHLYLSTNRSGTRALSLSRLIAAAGRVPRSFPLHKAVLLVRIVPRSAVQYMYGRPRPNPMPLRPRFHSSLVVPPSGSNCDNTGGQTNLISQKSTSLALLRFSGRASPLSVAVLPLPLRISRLSLSVRDRRGRVDSHSSYAVIPPSLTDKTQTWTL